MAGGELRYLLLLLIHNEHRRTSSARFSATIEVVNMPSRLRSSLLDLDDVAPTEDRPREGKQQQQHLYAGDSDDAADEDDSDEDDAAGPSRDHYVDVGSSSRRRRANLTEDQDGLLDSGKYRGREARWKDMMDGSEEEASEAQEASDEEEESDEDLSSIQDDDYHEVDDDDESIASSVSETSSEHPRAKKSVRFDASTKGEVSNDRANGSVPMSIASSLSNQATMMSSLRNQAQEDAIRGRVIKQELGFWHKTLENRIKMDRVVGARGIGKVRPSAFEDLLVASSPQVQDSAMQLISSLLDHSASLLALQSQVVASHGTEKLRSDIEQASNLKRKRDDSKSIDMETVRALHDQQVDLTLQFTADILQPFSKSTLDRVSTSRGSTGSDSNKFNGGSGLKALDQSITKQVDIAMAGDGGERLVERTKKFRGEGRRIGETEPPRIQPVEVDAEHNPQSSGSEEIDRETFDDADFYAALLRSLIESSSGSTAGLGGDANTPLQFHPKTNTKSRGVDTRASKGRKLRYEVIEKVANFMPRVGTREKWTEEMRDRLFAILPGGLNAAQESEEEEVAGQQTEADDLGGLRLFG